MAAVRDHRPHRGATRSRSLPLLCVTLLTSLLLIASDAHSQTIRGRVMDTVSGIGVEGALVELLDTDSLRLRYGLSGSGGTFVLTAPRLGSYLLRTSRIGYQSELLGPLQIRDDTLDLEVQTSVAPVELEGITAWGAGRCVLSPDEAVETQLLWSEAKKVLDVAALVHDSALFNLSGLRFQRELDLERLRLVNEITRLVHLPAPFHSPPEEELLTRGYVWKEGEKTVYSGPDPQVMLSATFLDTHCFRPVESDSANPPLVGLAFEPVEGRTLPDITGVLWMDEATAELSHLEYSYVRMENEELDNVGGGRAEFQQLENGAWIVRRWWITMPQVYTHDGIFGFFSREEVVGFEDTGGETLVASGGDGRSLLPRGRESVEGVVWDSLTGGPLSGATVYLSGTSHAAQSNADGTFLLQGLHPGEYLATFRHPDLDLPGVRQTVVEMAVHRGETGMLTLGTPSRDRVVEELCQLQPRAVGAVIIGTARERPGGPLIPGADVRIRIEGTGTYRIKADERGTFHFCLKKAEHDVSVSLLERGPDTEPVRFRAPRIGFPRVELFRYAGGDIRQSGRELAVTRWAVGWWVSDRPCWARRRPAPRFPATRSLGC